MVKLEFVLIIWHWPDCLISLVQIIFQCYLPDRQAANLHYPYPFNNAECRQGRVFEHQHHKYAESRYNFLHWLTLGCQSYSKMSDRSSGPFNGLIYRGKVFGVSPNWCLQGMNPLTIFLFLHHIQAVSIISSG